MTVFESSPVGGRLRVVELGGRKYESGGSIIHNSNKYMLDLLELCQLQKKKPLAGETFSLGQKNIVFQVIQEEKAAERRWLIFSLPGVGLLPSGQAATGSDLRPAPALETGAILPRGPPGLPDHLPPAGQRGGLPQCGGAPD